MREELLVSPVDHLAQRFQLVAHGAWENDEVLVNIFPGNNLSRRVNSVHMDVGFACLEDEY